jgi:hypothetical protein
MPVPAGIPANFTYGIFGVGSANITHTNPVMENRNVAGEALAYGTITFQ